jgi:uncharacterized membrane protein
MAERAIAATPERVEQTMFEPADYPRWMKAVRRVEVLPAEAGQPSRVRLEGRFLGKKIGWETELVERRPGRLHLRIPRGAFRGEVIYEVEPAAGGCVARMTNRGEAIRFPLVPRGLMVAAMSKAMAADLERLAALIEEGR